MEIITIGRSLTGRHYFRTDTGILWVGGKRESEAIASFFRALPRLDRFNPNQPRDARGRFSRTAGAGAITKELPLHKQKVSDLHKKLQDLGVDPNTLSHKARKSVLVAAIEAKGKGKDLREEGLLKPTKAKSTRSTVKLPKPPAAVEPPKPLRMVGDNAIAVYNKQEFKQLYKQWEEAGKTYQPVKDYLDHRMVAGDTKDYFDSLSSGKGFGEQTFVKTPNWLEMPDKAIKANRKYHEEQDNFTEKELGDGVKVFGNKFTQNGLATVLEGVEAGKFTVGMSGSTKLLHFNTRKEAEDFARNHARSATAARFIHREMVPTLQKTTEDYNQKTLEKLKNNIKKAGVADISEQNLGRISDNAWIRDSVFRTALTRDAGVVAVKDKSGHLQAALSYTPFKDFYDPDTKEKGALSIDYLATSPWNAARSNDPRLVSGAGARAIADAVRLSQKKGFGGRLSLSALEGAESFYEKIGFKRDEDGAFVLTSEKAKELVKKYG